MVEVEVMEEKRVHIKDLLYVFNIKNIERTLK